MPGRQIHDQVVEFSPHHRAQKLLDDGMQHGAAPDQRLVTGIQESDRDDFKAVGLERLNPIVAENLGLRVEAQHQRNIGAVNVGIEQADFVSQLGQNNGEIDRERGLSHTAFARTNGDDSAHTRQGLRRWRLLSGTRGKRRTHASIIREARATALSCQLSAVGKHSALGNLGLRLSANY